jgi:hypothetical protein
MSGFLATHPNLKRALLWGGLTLAPLAIVGAELMRAAGTGGPAPPADAAPAQPLQVAVLPTFGIDGGKDALRAIGEQTLFNPTRRPAPPALPVTEVEAPKPSLSRDAWLLMGTQIFGDQAVAYLKGAKDGKPKTVRQGDEVSDGVRLAAVTPDGIRLTAGQETETLKLKIATGPKTTIQPAVIEPPKPPAGPGGAQQQPNRPGAAPQPADAANQQSAAERRRAARAAAAAAAANRQAGAAGMDNAQQQGMGQPQ